MQNITREFVEDAKKSMTEIEDSTAELRLELKRFEENFKGQAKKIDQNVEDLSEVTTQFANVVDEFRENDFKSRVTEAENVLEIGGEY